MDKNFYKTVAGVKASVIRHPQFIRAYEQIIEAYNLNQQVGVQKHLLCIGPSGTGKSTLKKKIASTLTRRATKERIVVPVLVVDTPSLPTVKNMAEAMLLELGDEHFNKGSTIDKTFRIQSHLKNCCTKLIIFDELQHFVDQGDRRAPRQVSDWLKSIIDSSGASTILMGLENSEYILQVNEQLRRRFSQRIDLRPFSLASAVSFGEFIKVVESLDKSIGLPNHIQIDRDLATRIHFATNGIIGYIVNLLLAAFEVAQRDGSPGITVSVLEQAFTEAIWYRAKAPLNPFSQQFKFERLVKPGMPFFQTHRQSEGEF